MYTIVAYDKDNDVYVVLNDDNNMSVVEAKAEAERFLSLLNEGKLCRENGEPYDWIEVYYEYNKGNEAMVWASWETNE